MVMTVVVCGAIYLLAQIVTMTVLPDMTQSKTPVADAAAVFLGPAGALMIGVGSMLAITGNFTRQPARRLTLPLRVRRDRARSRAGSPTSTRASARPRARSGPRPRSRSRWRSRAPSRCSLAASAVARLLTYAGVSAAALALRHPRFRDSVEPPAYTVPFGPLVPSVAIVVSLSIIAGATAPQLAVGGAALAAGAVVFLAMRRAGLQARLDPLSGPSRENS